MPRLSVLMIRAALLYLGVGFLFGGLLLFNKGVPFAGSIWRLLPVHVELLIFGWMMQLIMGVAFWIAPRFSKTPRYGRVFLAELACVLLNLGTLLNAAGQWGGTLPLQLMGRVALLCAGFVFLFHLFPRIKPLSISSAESRLD
ncbi:MAG: hypothetical protein IAE80_28735 [Anaerolinea sp.]|nr:hypothetical protein [Anaerolinea sp.]